MRKFVCHVLVFLVLMMGINVGLYYVFAPTYWGVRNLAQFQSSSHQYNVLFFGNSRIKNQINPEIFDMVVQEKYHSNSYNLGVAGSAVFEEFYIFQHTLSQMEAKPQYIIFQVEWEGLGNFEKNTARYRYWLDFEMFQRVFRWLSRVPNQAESRMYIKHYIQRVFNMNVWRTAVQTLSSKTGLGFRGFFSLTKEIRPHNKQRILFEVDKERYDIALKELEKMENADCANIGYSYPVNILNEVITVSEEWGVTPFFVYTPPRVITSAYCAMEHIPERYKIEYPFIDNFPELYVRENFFDDGHFNEKGSKMYTEFVAKEFLRLLKGLN